ncbi:MAG: hypothetical protein VW338_00195 [Rhodospirillaceae bacterium]
MAEAQVDEREFQRWVVTSPWFNDLASTMGLTSDQMKAMLARQIFNDTEYDWRTMYSANLSPTVGAGKLSLPKATSIGTSLLSASQQIENFFTDRFGVASKFFGDTADAALRAASSLGFLPGYTTPGDVSDTSALAKSLNDYAASGVSFAADTAAPSPGLSFASDTAPPDNSLMNFDLSTLGSDIMERVSGIAGDVRTLAAPLTGPNQPPRAANPQELGILSGLIETYLTSPTSIPGLAYNATNLLANTVGRGLSALGFEGVNGPAVPFSERGVSMFNEPQRFSDAYYERTGIAPPGGGYGVGEDRLAALSRAAEDRDSNFGRSGTVSREDSLRGLSEPGTGGLY